ncbi:ER membrane protein complex subunit 4 [Microtus ochrogaster]|uniref:ER membrane protein complex subunit 4 n=1 Tax=Microtus ochrogaster TaxID=79684 RepID=A0A8J6G7M0_MICOH|nr:ER membrane protein complex subunit 4 [Microtus ochrogaster]
MTTQGGLVANRGRRFKWAIELSGPGGGSRGRSDRGSGQGDSLYPVGYLDKQVPDTSVQETDRILVEKRCWDIALGPLKQIPMNLFIMYMAGNTISIFPTMMVCMMAWRPIQALMAISATFKMLESSSQKFLQGLVYLIGNMMGLALAVYKCQSMGLLPTHASDWLAFIEPPEAISNNGNGHAHFLLRNSFQDLAVLIVREYLPLLGWQIMLSKSIVGAQLRKSGVGVVGKSCHLHG